MSTAFHFHKDARPVDHHEASSTNIVAPRAATETASGEE